MDTVTIESRTDALRRLAQVARESGVRLLRDDFGQMFATSVTEAGWLYPLEPDSCGCRGFAMHRRCRHIAALHAWLGWLNDEPDPEPTSSATATPAPDTCATCNGTGSECGTVASGRSWRYESIVCATCHGAGTVHLAA